jgi:hypothetical protein
MARKKGWGHTQILLRSKFEVGLATITILMDWVVCVLLIIEKAVI